MTLATAASTDTMTIPVVDITPLRDGSDPQLFARSLHAANTGLGFIYIKGHGIPEELISSARATALEFFHMSADAKETVRVTDNHRGWIGSGGAKMDDDAKPDLKESFVWGYQDKGAEILTDHNLRGVNKWPESLPNLEKTCMQYFKAAHDVAELLMRGFAMGLGLAEDAFLKTNDKPISRNSFVYYPPQEKGADDGQFGVGPHTDFGVLTVLCQDSVGGLQVQGLDGEWLDASPIEGTLIVNVGDLLARWTDGAYHSTVHRVINDTGKERLSIVLAYDPNPETSIDAKDIFGDGYVPKQDAITCGDYLDWRFARAFAHKNG